MAITKIVVSGDSTEENNEIIDDIFAALKAKNRPSIFLDDYEEGGGNQYLVSNDPHLTVVCLKRARHTA